MCAYNNESKTTFMIAALSLLIFNALYIPMRLYPHFHPDLMDGVRGMFLGITIGCLAITTWRNNRRRTA